jgi:hypothetical protein
VQTKENVLTGSLIRRIARLEVAGRNLEADVEKWTVKGIVKWTV